MPLFNQEVTEGDCVVLHCESNKPASSVEWRRGGQILKNGDKYQMRKKELLLELKILKTDLDDAGDYTCICGDQRTTATITVNGECSASCNITTSKNNLEHWVALSVITTLQ